MIFSKPLKKIVTNRNGGTGAKSGPAGVIRNFRIGKPGRIMGMLWDLKQLGLMKEKVLKATFKGQSHIQLLNKIEKNGTINFIITKTPTGNKAQQIMTKLVIP